MEKVNFINGQAPAINGTNLNQLQTNVENEFGDLSTLSTTDKTSVVNAINEVSNEIAKTENWILARLSTAFNAGTTAEHQIKFDTVQSVNGNLLTLENGCIKVGAGVKAIEVVAQLYFFTGTAGRKTLRIYKNTTDANRKYVTCESYRMFDITLFINVSEGDLIKFAAELTSGDIISEANTIIMARVIA